MRQSIACTLAVFLASTSARPQTPPPAAPQRTPDPPRPAQVVNAPAKPVVRLIATGGTIAMKIDPVKKAPSVYPSAPFSMMPSSPMLITPPRSLKHAPSDERGHG